MEKIRRDPRPNSQLSANPPVQSMTALTIHLLSSSWRRDVFFAQLFFQFCKPLCKIVGNSTYLCLRLFLSVRVGFVPFMEKRSYNPLVCSSALN